MNSWRSDCLGRILSAPSADALLLELRGIALQLGFDYCTYVLTAPVPLTQPRMLWSSNYPHAWLDRYQARNYLAVDPTIQQASAHTQPVVWSSAAGRSQHEFWEEAKSFGVCHGWTLVTHGPHMTTGLLSLARSHEAITAAELDENEARLVWLANQMQGLLDTAQLGTGMTEAMPPLTAREREVLRWSADGKTAEETGTILGITERTVTYHVTSAMGKLDTTNKTQAVAKALLLKLI